MFGNYGIASARKAMKTQRKDGNIVPRVASYLKGGMPVLSTISLLHCGSFGCADPVVDHSLQ